MTDTLASSVCSPLSVHILIGCPVAVCWLGGLLHPAVVVNASDSGSGAVMRLAEPGHTSKTECVFVLTYVCECVCFKHPVAGSSR